MTEQAALLDALKGAPGAATIAVIDEQAPAQEKDPLFVLDKPKPTAIAASDARHATAHGGKGYCVTVAGEYFAQSKDSNQKVRKPYRLDFNVPQLEGCLGDIVGLLLLPLLKKKHPDCINYRTHDIVETRPLSADTPESRNLQFMPRPALEKYILDAQAPINPSEYAETVDLRSAVMDHALNPVGFAEREKIKQADRAKLAELKALNPDLA